MTQFETRWQAIRDQIMAAKNNLRLVRSEHPKELNNFGGEMLQATHHLIEAEDIINNLNKKL